MPYLLFLGAASLPSFFGSVPILLPDLADLVIEISSPKLPIVKVTLPVPRATMVVAGSSVLNPILEVNMKRGLGCFVLTAVMLFLLAPQCTTAKDTKTDAFKLRERSTVSLQLEFSKRNPNALDKMMTVLNWGPNGYATGFMVGDGLVVTAYHVVSGEVGSYKKMALGFAPDEQLDVKVYVKGCHAKVMTFDKDADLALLEICGSRKNTVRPAFQSSPGKDEKLLLIARPHGDSILRQGVLSGSYTLNGLEYWSAKLNARDGFSGSPVYNQQAELVGVMSGYDPTKKLALISPVVRVQKLLESYTPQPRK